MPLSIYGDNWAMDDLICVITKQPKPIIIKEHKIRRDYNYLILHASGYIFTKLNLAKPKCEIKLLGESGHQYCRPFL